MSHKPIASSPAAYMRQIEEINENLLDLEEVAHLLTPRHKERLRKMAGPLEDNDLFTVDDVSEQYALVKKLRARVLDNEGELLEGFDPRALSTFITSLNTTITLFLKNQATIDHLKEVNFLQDAINEVVKDFSPEDQRKFYRRLEELRNAN